MSEDQSLLIEELKNENEKLWEEIDRLNNLLTGLEIVAGKIGEFLSTKKDRKIDEIIRDSINTNIKF